LRKTFLILPLILIILFQGCSKNSNTNNGTPIISNTSDTKDSEKGPAKDNIDNTTNTSENAISDFVFPIEGLRPYAVMIDNEGPRFTTQGGLDKAQVIYEITAEGGETRLMPLFWGVDPQMIGPVRSSRHYFIDYAMENDAIYVHFGWSPMAQQDIKKFKINNINGVANGGEIFWDIDSDKSNWQDSFTSMDKIKEYVKSVKYKTDTGDKLVFTYNKTDFDLSNGTKADKVDITYSEVYKCGFEYDSKTKTYLRFRRGTPQIERTTEKQLSARNIIIQDVECNDIKGDDKGRQQVKDVGSGTGWFVTSGLAVEINWSKETRSTPTKYTDMAGNLVILNPGQTWVQIVPTSGKVTIE
jgi:hypothetical protein